MFGLLRTFLFWLLAPVGLLLIVGLSPWWLLVGYVVLVVLICVLFPPGSRER